MSKRLELEVATTLVVDVLLENPVFPMPEDDGEEVYLVVLTKLLLLLVVVEDDKGTVPVGSNPLDLFRLASGHPDALHKMMIKINKK